VGFALVLASGAVQYFSGLDFLRHRPIRYANQLPRITSCFEFADQYAVYLIYMVFVYGFLVWDRNAALPGRIGSAALMLAGVASLFFTHARSGWIGFIAALVASVFFMKRAWLILAGLMTVLVFLLLASPSDVLIHKDSHGREQSLAERWTLWNRALEIVKRHPLTGIGINTYAVSGDRYRKDEKQNLSHYYAHNSYLQMAAESGLISIALFLAIPALFFFRAVRVIRSGDLPSGGACFLKAAFSGTVGFLVLNYFESALFSVQPSQLFYFFLGTGAALLKPSTEDRR
jgi:O-antigen ligase